MRRFGTDWEELGLTFDEALSRSIEKIYEDSEFYYITPKKEDCYDNSMYQADKRTKKVYNFTFTCFVSNVRNAAAVTSKEIKIRNSG